MQFSINETAQAGQKIIVIGGIDSSTGQAFTGELSANANSNYVSPLTSLVQDLVDQGLSQEQAQQQVNVSLGLDEQTDLGLVNPMTNSTILQPNVLIAQLIKETTEVLSSLSSEGAEDNNILLRELPNVKP